ncbi:MAG: hypothetical protein V3U60_16545 [Gammaproteobacteria bacterium]
MAYETATLTCIGGDSKVTEWAYNTSDKPGEVLEPGYFPDDCKINFMRSGEKLTINCWSENRRYDSTPIMVAKGVVSVTEGRIWHFLSPQSPAWPAKSNASRDKALIAA